jgi:molybdenum cofactor cytidylyltransferase
VIPAVVLAAGQSTRMGRTKATLRLGPHDTFLTRILRTLADAAPDVADIVVVVGHDADAVIASVADCGVSARFVLNADYESGQLSSVLAGLRAIDRPGTSAMLLTLVDVPLVAASTVRAVVDGFRRTRAAVVRPVKGAEHGHPVLIDRSLFDAIRRADPAVGIKPVVRAHVSAAGDIALADPGAFTDIDTPAEYERILEGLQGTAGG